MGFAFGYVLRLVTLYVFTITSSFLLLFISLIILIITYLFLKDMQFSGHVQTIKELSITQPETFVPFTHKIFITIFIFSISFGFALAFGSIHGNPVQSALVYIPLLVLLAFIPFLKFSKEDFLYQVSTMLVVAGYLSSIVYLNFDSQYLNISNGLLVVGSEVFELLVWLMLSRISYRNIQNAVLVIAWGRLANSVGILIGANLGHLINYFAQIRFASQLIAIILFVFILLVVVIIKDLNFTEIVKGIKETELVNPNELMLQNFDNKVALATEQYQLTPRESEVYSLMVRGRNAGYINEELGISINTVKTHVSNIYKKLEVHSQQKLIDHFEELNLNSVAQQRG